MSFPVCTSWHQEEGASRHLSQWRSFSAPWRKTGRHGYIEQHITWRFSANSGTLPAPYARLLTLILYFLYRFLHFCTRMALFMSHLLLFFMLSASRLLVLYISMYHISLNQQHALSAHIYMYFSVHQEEEKEKGEGEGEGRSVYSSSLLTIYNHVLVLSSAYAYLLCLSSISLFVPYINPQNTVAYNI